LTSVWEAYSVILLRERLREEMERKIAPFGATN